MPVDAEVPTSTRGISAGLKLCCFFLQQPSSGRTTLEIGRHLGLSLVSELTRQDTAASSWRNRYSYCTCIGSLSACQATAPPRRPNTTAAVCGKTNTEEPLNEKKTLGSRPSVPRLGWHWRRNPCDSRSAAWHVAAFRPESLCRPGWPPQTVISRVASAPR